MDETSVYGVAILGAGPSGTAAASARAQYSAKHEGQATKEESNHMRKTISCPRISHADNGAGYVVEIGCQIGDGHEWR